MKLKNILIIILVILIQITNVSAESGQLYIDAITQNTNYIPAGGTMFTGGTGDWGVFYFDTTNYNSISELKMNWGGTYPKQTDTTTFTCISGCTGTGIVYYHAPTDNVYWFFDSGFSVTSSPFTITYANTGFFTGFTKAFIRYRDTNDIGTTKPIEMKSTFGAGTVLAEITYTSITSKIARNNYIINYTIVNQNIFFNTYIDKSPTTISTKIKILNISGNTYFQESSFNTVSFASTSEYNKGIILSMQTSDGYFNNLTINTTDAVEPTLIEGSGGSLHGMINFDSIQRYYKGYFGVNVTMNSTTYNSTKRYFIDVFDATGAEKVGFPIEISAATYSTGRQWVFSNYGLWNATLTYCNQFNFFCSPTGFTGLPPSYQQLIDCVNNPLCGQRSGLLDTAVQVINTTSYAYSVTSDADKYSTNDTIYFTITSTNPSGTYFTIVDSKANVMNSLANNILIGQGTTTVNITIPTTIQNGNYTAILTLNTGYYAQVASKTFEIGIVSGRDSISWGDNNIFGYTNMLSYSNGNSTNYIAVSKMMNNSVVEVDNFSISPLTTSSKNYLMDTVSFWSAKLHNTTSNTNKFANISVFASSVGLCNTKLADFVCFNNQSYYPGDPYNVNYQVSSIPNCVLAGPCIEPRSKLYVKVLDPNNNLIFNKTISDCSGSIVSCYVKLPIIETATSKFKQTNIPGTYQVQLIYYHKKEVAPYDFDTVEDVLASNTAIVVNKATIPVPTSSTERGSVSNPLSLSFFPLMIIWFAFAAVGLLVSRDKYGLILGTGMAVPTLWSMNLIPLWAVFLIAVMILLALSGEVSNFFMSLGKKGS